MGKRRGTTPGGYLVRSAVLGCAIALLAGVLAPAEAASTRVERQSYTLGTDVAHACEVDVGGGCFVLRPTDRSVTIDIQDRTGMRVDAIYQFTDAYGAVHRTGAVCGKGRLRIPDGANKLDVFLSTLTLGALACAATDGPAAATTGVIVATFDVGSRRVFSKVPVSAQDCSTQTPEALGVKGVTDGGETVSLDVIVLLDGVAKDVAQKAFVEAARSYAPLGITLRVRSYRKVSFVDTDAPYLISQSKALFGGSVPKGADVVYTLTSKSPLKVLNQAVAGGQGDCIGGIRWANRSFIVGTVLEPTAIGPFTFYKYGTARIIAHEIGHILGAQHEQANCVEGMADFALDDPTPCTLMSNFADFDSRDFGTIEAAVVRGFAVKYAKP